MTKDLKSKLLKLLNCKQVGRDVDEGIFTLFALLTSEYSLSNTVWYGKQLLIKYYLILFLFTNIIHALNAKVLEY